MRRDRFLVFLGVGAVSLPLVIFFQPAKAQTIGPALGCQAGVACQATTMAIGGAPLGGNALAVTGSASVSVSLTAPQLAVGGASGQGLTFGATGGLYSSGADGAMRLTNSAGTGFDRLQFGGTTNAFPALKRVGASLQVDLADGASKTVLLAASFQADSGQQFFWFNRSRLFSPADGNVLLSNNASAGFGLLQFGGTNSSFPALKRNASQIELRLADDSGRAGLLAETVAAASYITTGPRVVINLTTCNSSIQGAQSFVTDASVAAAGNFGAELFGGGSNAVPVYCDGASWRIG